MTDAQLILGTFCFSGFLILVGTAVGEYYKARGAKHDERD